MSFGNPIHDQTFKMPDPEVGMGCTQMMWTDRNAYTVMEVLSPTRITVTRDRAKRTDKNGLSESQTYEYTTDPDGCPLIVTKRRNGRWVAQGDSQTSSHFAMGERSTYSDPSF